MARFHKHETPAGSRCRSMALLLTASAFLFNVAGTASAGDNAGVIGFFTQQAEAARQVEAAPAPRPTLDAPMHPLTIRKSYDRRVEFRPYKPRVVARAPSPRPTAPKIQVASLDNQVPSKPKPITIYDDPTLRRGDAVMTEQGLRIFLGSKSFPYQQADFRTIGAGTGISEQYRKALMEIDQRVPSAG